MTEMKANVEYKEICDVFKDLKDFKDYANHIDFENAPVIRGQTPEGIEDQCLSLCQQYLAGNWLTQTKDTVKVTRIVGGWMNQLYYIKINEPKGDEKVPQEVLIKFDSGIPIEGFELKDKLLKDMIIAMAFSAKGLGPKVYGVFDKGVIQLYYKHRCFHKKEHDNTAIVEKVFRKLAHVHALDVPIKKDPGDQYPSGTIQETLEKARKKFDLKKEIEEYNCEDLKIFDFDGEIKWFREKLYEIQSPVVFTHNDYKDNNLLITEPNDDLIICDFDTACYGYRGSDLFRLYSGPGFLRDPAKVIEDFPVKDEVFASLIALYVDECTKIHGKAFTDDPNNSVEHILKETKFFWAFGGLGFATMFLSSDPNDKNSIFTMPRKIALEMANNGVKNYLAIKQLLINNNIVCQD